MEIKITIERLKELERSEQKLNALEIGGVDNWEFYGEAMDEYNKECAFEADLDDAIIELETTILSNKYEPSERGAGFALSDSGRDDVYLILKDLIEKYKTK